MAHHTRSLASDRVSPHCLGGKVGRWRLCRWRIPRLRITPGRLPPEEYVEEVRSVCWPSWRRHGAATSASPVRIWGRPLHAAFDFLGGRRILNPARRVRIPYAVLVAPRSTSGRSSAFQADQTGPTPVRGTTRCSEVWYRACLGRRRPSVRIRPPRSQSSACSAVW